MIFKNVGIFVWLVFSPYLFYIRKESGLLSDLNQALRAVWLRLGPFLLLQRPLTRILGAGGIKVL